MYVRHLSVADFRSWTSADLALEPGPSVLVGANGQGKTNLIEALGYVATLGSHRVPTDAPLVRARRRPRDRAVRGGRRRPRAAGRARDHAGTGQPGPAQRCAAAPRPRRARRAALGAVRAGGSRDRARRPERAAPVHGRAHRVAIARGWPAVRADYDRVLKQRAALLKSAGAARRGAGAGVDRGHPGCVGRPSGRARRAAAGGPARGGGGAASPRRRRVRAGRAGQPGLHPALLLGPGRRGAGPGRRAGPGPRRAAGGACSPSWSGCGRPSWSAGSTWSVRTATTLDLAIGRVAGPRLRQPRRGAGRARSRCGWAVTSCCARSCRGAPNRCSCSMTCSPNSTRAGASNSPSSRPRPSSRSSPPRSPSDVPAELAGTRFDVVDGAVRRA